MGKPHNKAVVYHLPYGLTQYYLPPDASERTLPEPQPGKLVLDLPTQERWKAELTYLAGYITNGLPASRRSKY